MISTVTLTFDLTYVDPLTQTVVPKGIVTDSTNYTALGLIPADFELKGLGQITFNGTLIEDFNTVLNPLIPLDSGVSTFLFDLPLDVNGNVANGVYTLLYRLRVSSQLTDTPVTATAPSLVTAVSNQWIANFLEAGDSIDVVEPFSSPETVTVLAVNQVGANAEITVSNYALSSPEYITFDIIHDQLSAVYNYSGCVQSAAKVNFTYDCEYGDNGTFAVSNATELNGQTVLSLSAMINYPSWTSSNPNFNPQIITNTLPYSNNVLATGTFNVSLSEVIEKVQNDGLIIQYTASSIQEFNVSCIGSLCNLIPCIESLRNAHAIELQRNRISKYQVYVDNVLMYYAEAQNYRSCGDLEAYRNTLALLEAQLDASGCECGCCDPDTYQWVSNNSSATIESLINAIQFQLKAGVPDGDDDSTKGVQVGAIWEDTLTQTLYICTSNGVGTATWDVFLPPGGFLTPNNGLSTSGSDIVLGGALTGNTQINTQSYNFKVTTSSNSIPLVAESSSSSLPAFLILKTSAPVSSINEAERIRVLNTSGTQNGFGASTNVYLSNSVNNEQLASRLITSWEDSANNKSAFSIQTNNGGSLSNKLILQSDGQLTLPQYSGNLFVETPTYSLGVNALGEVVQSTPSSVNPTNGLSLSGGDIVLGGTLTGNTTIDTSGYSLIIDKTTPGLTLKVQGISTPLYAKRTSFAGSPNSQSSIMLLVGEKSDAGNGYGTSIDTSLSDGSGGFVTTSRIVTKWNNISTTDSVLEFQNSNSGGGIDAKLRLKGDGYINIPYYGGGTQTGTATYNLSVDQFGDIVETPVSSSPQVYVARITQTGSSAPTATVIANTTGANFTWGITVAGVYSLTASSPVLTTDKTAIYVTPSSSGAYIMMASVLSTTQCTVTSSNGFGLSGYANGLINGAIVKIEIYP